MYRVVGVMDRKNDNTIIEMNQKEAIHQGQQDFQLCRDDRVI